MDLQVNNKKLPWKPSQISLVTGYMVTKSSAQWQHHSTDIVQTDANLEVRHLVFKSSYEVHLPLGLSNKLLGFILCWHTLLIWLLKTYLKLRTNFYFPGNTNFWIIEQLKVSLLHAVIPTSVRRGVSQAFEDFPTVCSCNAL